jgi:hypothetical protein
MRKYIIEALHNYGYRCVGKKDNNIIFAKTMGYSVISAEIIQNKSNFKLEMVLLVKGTDGENLVWTSEKNTLKNIKNDEEYYLNVMQIIMDFEASILDGKFAWEINRNKRFDFIENTKLLNELD